MFNFIYQKMLDPSDPNSWLRHSISVYLYYAAASTPFGIIFIFLCFIPNHNSVYLYYELYTILNAWWLCFYVQNVSESVYLGHCFRLGVSNTCFYYQCNLLTKNEIFSCLQLMCNLIIHTTIYLILLHLFVVTW